MLHALRYAFLLLLIAVLALGWWLLPNIKYESDVMALFPGNARAPEIARANVLLEEGVTEKVFFLLSSSNWEATQKAIPGFASTLRECQCIEAVSSMQNAEEFSRLKQFYQQYAPVILSDKDRVLLRQGQGEILVQNALREFLANPAGVSANDLRQDPLGTVEDYLAGLRQQIAGAGAVESGFLYFTDEKADRRHVLIMAELAGSPYSLEVQSAADEAIAAAEAYFRDAVPEPGIVHTGAFFYTRAGTDQAQLEISTVGLGSLIGVILILLLVFRSPLLLLLAFVPIGAGVLSGLLATQLVFGSVHVIALVFGASLVGVSIDYSLHFLCKRQAMGPDWQPEVGLRRLMPGLTLGLLTSLAGYLSFVAAGFPGLRQVAVFSCAGLVAAYIVVTGLYPWILRKPAKIPAPGFVRRGLPRYLTGAHQALRRLRFPEFAVPLLVLAAIGVWRLEMQDDVRAMQTPDPQLQEQEARFRELVGSTTALQYLLVQADSEEKLLQKLEQLQTPLQKLQTDGVMDSYLNLASWVPSRATQQQNNKLLREHLIPNGLLQDYLNTLAVNRETQATLLQSYIQPNEQPLKLEDALPLLEGLLRRPLYFTNNGHHYSFILLEGLHKQTPLQELAAANERVFWVDRVASTSELLKKYRHSASWVLAFAYVVIFLVLMVRYHWKGALAVVAPPLLGSLFAVSMLGWLGIGLSVFNVMALLLILGIGIDYTLFLRESRGRGYDTLFAIVLAGLTTLLSFGLLSLSATQAIFSFGLTILFGIAASFALAPLSLPSRSPSAS